MACPKCGAVLVNSRDGCAFVKACPNGDYEEYL